MEKLFNFASMEEVVSAVELVYEEEGIGERVSKPFSLDQTVAVVNYGCIKDNDKVIVMASHLDRIIGLISYMYTPQKLVAHGLDPSNSMDMEKWNKTKLLLSEYWHTEPHFNNSALSSVEYPEPIYDVAVAGYINQNACMDGVQHSRFHLQAGIGYEFFERLLVKSSSLLRKGGILLLLSKPSWVLKAWEAIHELGLQLEYNYYRLYTESGHANAFVWLRFVKREDQVDLELQKKNMRLLMCDNGIDRLYAHRNNLRFPYVELSYCNREAYVKLDQDLEHSQYFFSTQTTASLAKLCQGYTACLVTPSIAAYAHKLEKNVVLFERDNRFRNNGGLKYVKYDLNTGLTKLLQNRYARKFDRVICDPPFDIKLDVLARDIVELIKNKEGSIAYIVYPESRRISLINAMRSKGLQMDDKIEAIDIEYAKPPKLVRTHGKSAIQLFKFTYTVDSA